MPIYLKIDGIEGESMSPQYGGYMDVFGSSWGVERDVAGGPGGGGGNRPDLSDISITKPAAKGSPNLFLACCSGKQLERAEIAYTEVMPGAEVKYMVVHLERVIISSWNSSGDGGAVPTESVTLNYAKITWEYKAQDGSVESASWDKKKNAGG